MGGQYAPSLGEGSSMMRDLLNDRMVLGLALIILVGISSVVVLGIDVAYSSQGSGTIVSLNTVTNNGKFSYYVGTISTPNGSFTANLTCINDTVGAKVQWTHDFLDGYILEGSTATAC